MHRWNSDQTSEKPSSSSTSWWQWNENWWSFFLKKKESCSKIVYNWWQSAATDGCVWTEHPHTSHFLVFARMFNSVAHDTGSRCSAHHVIHVSCALSGCASWFLFDSPLCILHSLIFYFILLIFIIFHVGRFGETYPVRFREWGVRHFGRQHTSHSLDSLSGFPGCSRVFSVSLQEHRLWSIFWLWETLYLDSLDGSR